jgi:bifunctional DNase/RNase
MAKGKNTRLAAIAVIWLVVSLWLVGKLVAGQTVPITPDQEELLRVKVYQLITDPTNKQPVVLLADPSEKDALLIWIDFYEANAIFFELQGIRHSRPLTHDLLKSIIQKDDGKIHHVVITHVEEGIYHATIVIEKGDTLVEVDARPSDSIVMALKFEAPIFVSRSLFRGMAIPLREHAETERGYGVTLQDLNPSLAEAFSFGSTRGVLVSDVREGSRAERDGLQRGDIFVEVGGQTVESVALLRDVLARSIGPLTARIFRKSEFVSKTIHPK